MQSVSGGRETALVLLLLGGVIAGVSITELAVTPIEGGSATAAPSDIHVDATQLTYSGTSVDGMAVVVNNTRSLSAIVTVTVELKNASGSTVASGSTTVTADAGTTTRVTVTFDTAVSPSKYASAKVTVTE